MPHPLKKTSKFLIQLFGQFQRVFSRNYQRRLNEDELVDLGLPSRESLLVLDLPLLLTGLGVYQGEAIVIRSSKSDKPYQNLVIDKLQYHALGHIELDTLKNLHCLAHRLEYEKRFYPQMTDLQRQAIIKLDECPLMNQCNALPLKPYEVEACNDAILSTQERKPDQNPPVPQCPMQNSELPCPLLYQKRIK